MKFISIFIKVSSQYVFIENRCVFNCMFELLDDDFLSFLISIKVIRLRDFKINLSNNDLFINFLILLLENFFSYFSLIS